MIDKLNIKNFLTFDSLEIDSLKRINLIGGKNNAGKTSFLEALLILISRGDNNTINYIIENRGISKRQPRENYEEIIHNGIVNGINAASINNFELRSPPGINSEYSVKFNGHDIPLHAGSPGNYNYSYFSFVSSKTNLEEIALMWEEIVLTDIEDDVLQIVKDVVDDRITRIHISNRSVLSKINGKPVNIKTLGEGVSRILFIALSLAKAKGKYLLIDEVETGLHYTAQEKLWEIIFEYAHKWDIQVFATTHSSDTIRAFKYASTKFQKNGKIDAQYLRLQKSRSGKFEAIPFDIERLHTSLDLNLEIR